MRRLHMSFGQFTDIVSAGIVFALIAGFVGAALTAAILSDAHHNSIAARESQIEAMDIIRALPGTPEELAQSLEKLEQKYVENLDLLGSLLEYKDVISNAANSGAEYQFPEASPIIDFDVAKNFWLGLGAFSILLGLSMLVCLRLDESFEESHICDLPWAKPWLYPFFVLMIPVGFPFFIISGAHLWRNHRRPRAVVRPNIIFTIEERARGLGTTAPLAPTTPSYSDSTMEAWVRLRSDSLSTKIDSDLARAAQDKLSAREELTRLGNDIAKNQKRMSRAAKREEELRAAQAMASSVPIDRAKLEAEFGRLIKLPSVASVSISGNSILVELSRVTTDVGGKSYELGDYRLVLRNEEPFVEVFCTRQAGNQSHYYLNEVANSFCFGDERNPEISRLIQIGEYLPALAMAIEGLHTINPENQSRVPDDFPEVRNARVLQNAG